MQQGYRNFQQGAGQGQGQFIQQQQQQQFTQQQFIQQQQQIQHGQNPQQPQFAPNRGPQHTPGKRAGGHGGLAMPPAPPAAMAANQEAQRIALELAKRRSRKPTDKNIPEGVEEVVIGDGVANYKRLREVERRLDAQMMRKRMDIQDGRGSNMKRFRTLRVWISNTVEDQEWQGGNVEVDAFDFTTRRDASWKVKIEGRLLDEDEEDDTDSEDEEEAADADKMELEKKKAPKKSKYRFSHFFKSLTVEFEKSRTLNSDFPVVEWKKPIIPPNARNVPATADFDCLEFKRGGDENQNVIIKLVRDENPDRFRLSPPLREVVDQDEATRAEVITGVWEYIKAMGLQDEEDRRAFRCDELLRQIFNRDTFSIPFIQEALTSHMTPLLPLELPYTIRVDKEFHESNPQPTIYDIQLPLDSSLRIAMQEHLRNPSYAPALQEIGKLNDETAVIIAALQHSKAKHIFLENLAKNPVEWLNKWVNSQQRDLEIIRGEAARTSELSSGGEEWRKGGDRGAWGTEGAREAAAIYLHKDAVLRGVRDRV